MEEITTPLKIAFADTFQMYLKTHNFHWNVEGPDFYEFHSLFEAIYSEVYGAIDAFAEEIRAQDAYAPGSLGRLATLATIQDEITVPSGLKMAQILFEDNARVIVSLKLAHAAAEQYGERGLVNFLEDRLDKHKKHAWFLRATIKTV
jgi:starvation-inducible DNA-binding protein